MYGILELSSLRIPRPFPILAALALLTFMARSLQADIVFSENFDDGVANGFDCFIGGCRIAANGDDGEYAFGPPTESVASFASSFGDPRFRDGVVRATVRANTSETLMFVDQRVVGGPRGYRFAADARDSSFSIQRLEGSGSAVLLSQLDPLQYPFVPGEEWVIEGRIVDEQISLKVWRAADLLPPDAPQLTVTDTTYSSGGLVIGVDHGDSGGVFDDLSFREIVLGDFNYDGRLDSSDVDLLTPGLNDLRFDLDNNGVVNVADRRVWAEDLKKTFFGDTDLDGQVNSVDLNTLALSWRSTAATSWAQGDFNGDGNVNSSDLNDLALNWRSGVAAAASTPAVPEPSSVALLILGGLALVRTASGHRQSQGC